MVADEGVLPLTWRRIIAYEAATLLVSSGSTLSALQSLDCGRSSTDVAWLLRSWVAPHFSSPHEDRVERFSWSHVYQIGPTFEISRTLCSLLQDMWKTFGIVAAVVVE